MTEVLESYIGKGLCSFHLDLIHLPITFLVGIFRVNRIMDRFVPIGSDDGSNNFWAIIKAK